MTAASEEAIWGAYAATLLFVEAEGGPLMFEPAEPGMCGKWPLTGGSLHVVTAWNPRSVPLTDPENRARHGRLQAVIDLLGYHSVPVTGQAVTGAWPPESGLGLIDVSRERAVAVGVLFDQTAVFELVPDALRIVGCFEDRITECGWVLA